MKPSDDPRSPFSPNWKSPINWRTQNLDKQRGTAVSMQVEKERLSNENYGKLTGISKTERMNLLPKQFHVYSKAVPSKGKK